MEEYVGIDVGAKSVVVCVRRGGRTIRTQTFPQTPEGHRALLTHHAGRPAWCLKLRGSITWTWP
jgi:hypothetical protein